MVITNSNDKFLDKNGTQHLIDNLKDYTNKQVLAAGSGGGIDLSEYAKVVYVDSGLSQKSNISHTHSYNDLENKPVIPTVDVNKEYVDTQLIGKANQTDLNTTNANVTLKAEKTYVDTQLATKSDINHTHAQLHAHDNKSVLDGITDLKVSSWDSKSNFSGSYNDLTDKTNVDNHIVNTTIHVTQTDKDTWNAILGTAKSYSDSLFSGVTSFDVKVVDSLPVSNIDTHAIYFVLKEQTTNDSYNEFMYINNAWEHIGSTEVDLSSYYKKEETDTLLSNKVDKIDDKGLSTNDFTTDEKTKLSGIETGANKIIVDTVMDSLSTNPVQNKIVKTAIDLKVDKISGKGLSANDLTNTLKSNYDGAYSHLTRTDNPHSVTKTQVGLSTVTNDKQVKGLSSGTTNGNLVKFGADGYTVADSGESVATLKKDVTVNMLKPTLQTTVSNGITFTNNGDGTYTLNGTASGDTGLTLQSLSLASGLKLKLTGCPKVGSTGLYHIYIDRPNVTEELADTGNGAIFTSNGTEQRVRIYIASGMIFDNAVFKPMLTTNLSATYSDFVQFTGTNKRLNEDVAAHETSISSIKNDIADQYSASSTYAIGSLVIYNNSLYKCTTAITVAEAWNSAHWTPTTLDNEIIANKTAIATTNTNLSTTNTNLITTNTNLAQLLVVEKKSTTADVTVSANTYANVTIPISKTGYTPIGVVGAASQINCPFFGFSISPDKLNVLLYARNVTASNVTTSMNADILYMKNLS